MIEEITCTGLSGSANLSALLFCFGFLPGFLGGIFKIGLLDIVESTLPVWTSPSHVSYSDPNEVLHEDEVQLVQQYKIKMFPI